MKKLIYFIVLFIFFANSVFAKTYIADKQMSDINVKRKDIIIVKLKENPSTGYSWIFNVNDKNNKILEELERKHIAPKTNLVGVGGYTYYKLKAVKKGETEVNGIYKRPWENNDGIYKYTLKIKVR